MNSLHIIAQGEDLSGDYSIARTFSQMSERAQRHLPFIGLFATSVHAGMPGEFPRLDDEKLKLYEEVIGEVIDTESWKSILDEAHQAGLIGHAGGEIYGLPAAFATFLRQKLMEIAGPQRLKQFDEEFVRFYAVWAAAMLGSARNSNPDTLRAIEAEESNLLRAVQIAETRKMRAEVRAFASTLREFYEARSRTAELREIGKKIGDKEG